MSDDNLSLHQLLEARATVLSSGSNWEDYSEAQCESAMATLDAIQDKIVQHPMKDSETRLAVLATLLDSHDQPGFADNFKNRLFNALRSY